MLWNGIAGAASYAHYAFETLQTLKTVGEGSFRIFDRDRLFWLARRCGVSVNGSPWQVACWLADLMLFELRRGQGESSKIIEVFSLPERRQIWREMGLYPAGLFLEIEEAAALCRNENEGEGAVLARKSLKLSLAAIYGAQFGLDLVQDILFGTSGPYEEVFFAPNPDPRYVNVLVGGFDTWMGISVHLAAKSPAVQNLARTAGAKGLRVFEAPKEGTEKMFTGLGGVIDVATADPKEPERFWTGFGADLEQRPREAAQKAFGLLNTAIENFKHRRDRIITPSGSGVSAVAGFSTETVAKTLGGSLDPLVWAIKSGKIRGLVIWINRPGLRTGPDRYSENMTGEFIKRDILMVTGGLGPSSLETAGLCSREAVNLAGAGLWEFCTEYALPPVINFGPGADMAKLVLMATAVAEQLGVDTMNLPAAAVVPDWVDPKTVNDAMFALAFGFLCVMAPAAPYAGIPGLVKFLTRDLEYQTGGKVFFSKDPLEGVKAVKKHIEKQRGKIGLD